eukprot:COSAG03_NODE_13727_length_491_cov_1.020408_1_plen_35_part_10
MIMLVLTPALLSSSLFGTLSDLTDRLKPDLVWPGS